MSARDSPEMGLKREPARQVPIYLIRFSKVVSEVTQHHFHCMIFIRSESLRSVCFQEKRDLDSILGERSVQAFVDMFFKPP